MVEIGGEIVVNGNSEKLQPWRIGINKPTDDSLNTNQAIQDVVSVSNIAMATSGNYRNFYYKNGKKYAHTMTRRQAIQCSTTSFLPPYLQMTVPLPMPMPPRSWYWDWMEPRRSWRNIPSFAPI